MPRVLCFFFVIAAACLTIAAGRGDFEHHSGEAAENYSLPTSEGYDYAAKFAHWGAEAMMHRMDVCQSHPFSNRYCDIIAVVAADGHIRRLLFSPSNPYVDCMRKDLRLGAVAPRPPRDSWPVQIRLIDGPRPNYRG